MPLRRATAELIRAVPLEDFMPEAAAINDSDALMAVYAVPEWAELSDDGKLWVAAFVRETLARAAERLAESGK